LTGSIKEANCGGNGGSDLARLGVKVLVVEGQPADGKLYQLYISSAGVKLLPADEWRGLDTYATAAKARERWGSSTLLLLTCRASSGCAFCSSSSIGSTPTPKCPLATSLPMSATRMSTPMRTKRWAAGLMDHPGNQIFHQDPNHLTGYLLHWQPFGIIGTICDWRTNDAVLESLPGDLTARKTVRT
jgi:hypothetical protein